MVGSIIAFVLSVLWVSGQFVYLGYRKGQLTKKIGTLNSLYSARSKDQVEYLAIKQIIDTVNKIQTQRFRYKDFLTAIYKLLPSGAKLSAVDFSQAGVIRATTRLANLNDYDVLLANIKSESLDKTFLFSLIAQPFLQRDKTGHYAVALELKIK